MTNDLTMADVLREMLLIVRAVRDAPDIDVTSPSDLLGFLYCHMRDRIAELDSHRERATQAWVCEKFERPQDGHLCLKCGNPDYAHPVPPAPIPPSPVQVSNLFVGPGTTTPPGPVPFSFADAVPPSPPAEGGWPNECRKCKGVGFVVGIGLSEESHGRFVERGLPIDCPDCVGLYIPQPTPGSAAPTPSTAGSVETAWDADQIANDIAVEIDWHQCAAPGTVDLHEATNLIREALKAAHTEGKKVALPEWQPIKDAPKDTRLECLDNREGCISVCDWDDDGKCWWDIHADQPAHPTHFRIHTPPSRAYLTGGGA